MVTCFLELSVSDSSTAFVEVGGSLEPLRSPFLMSLGERVRNLRSRKGMTRKAVAMAADVSERHLANLEYGTGNVSVLVLLQVSHALQCSLAEDHILNGYLFFGVIGVRFIDRIC